VNLPVRFRRLARDEYVAALAWHAAAWPELAERFEAAVEAVLAEAATNPERFPIAEADAREAAVPGFPYCIYYRVQRDTLSVLAVYHQSRSPEGWKSRV